MKLKITTLLFLNLFFGNFIYSQGLAANFGYHYAGRSAGFAGVDYRLSMEQDPAKNIGIGAYLTSINKEFTIIPEIHYNQVINNDSGLMWQISASTKNLKPSLGFNFLNAIHLDVGYSFGLDKAKDLHGFAVGLNFFLGKKRFYDTLKIIQ